MIVSFASSSKLREVVVGTADRLKAIDAEYLEMVKDPNVSIRRVKTNRSQRWWILKDDADCREELTLRGEEYTIPYWAKVS